MADVGRWLWSAGGVMGRAVGLWLLVVGCSASSEPAVPSGTEDRGSLAGGAELPATSAPSAAGPTPAATKTASPTSAGPRPTATSLTGARPAGTASAPVAERDERCVDRASAERAEIGAGEMVKTASAVAVTFDAWEHDSFDDGTTDMAVNLTFREILPNGSLAPAASRWRPSILGSPRWVHMGSIPLCVRLVKTSDDKVVIDLFRAPSR